MIENNQIEAVLTHGTVEGLNGEKIGSAGQIYVDDRTGSPAWVTVRTGMFGTSESFVPLAQAQVEGSTVRVPYSKDMVKDAPRVESDGHISDAEQDELYRYYSVNPAASGEDTVPGQRAAGTVAADTAPAAASAGSADDAMTRSEERLHVGTESHETGRVRLRKYVVTENVTTTVPVQREEVRLEREPVTDANRGEALSGQDLAEDEHEVILHAERPVVEKETVPVERVRAEKETVTENVAVTEDVSKEKIELERDSRK